MIYTVLIIGLCILSAITVFRIFYYLLPSKSAYVESVFCNEKINGQLIQVLCEVMYRVDNARRNKLVTRVYKKNNFGLCEDYIEGLKGLQGKNIDYHYIPYFSRFGYLGNSMLLIPVWVYLIILIAYLLPIILIIN